MEGNGGGFPYFYPHLIPGHADAAVGGFTDGAEAAGVFPSPSPSSAGGEGGGNPALFPQSAVTPAAPVPPVVEPARKKRGRPRKYGLASSSPPPPHSTSTAAAPSVSASRSSPPSGLGASSSPSLNLYSPTPRSAAGRKKARRESGGKGGQGFTPHFLTVAAGEDVVQRIMSFVQQQRRAVCIMSASGTIASVTLRQPAMSGGHVTYEGHFDIVTLSGSFLLTETGGAYSRTGALSVSLSDERCILGGGVSGPLVAAGPVQVLAGSFLVGSDTYLAAHANVENTMSNVTPVFPAGADVSPTVGLWSTADSSRRMSTNSGPDGHYQSTTGSGNSFVLQPRAAHVMPSRSSTDLGARVESGHPGAAYRLPGADEHIHE